MKKIKKISLFIIGFYILLLLFSNSKVQAADVVTVTTVQELQEVMGATAYSTIDGTTLKITNDFTWNIADTIYLNISIITIDFNGKKIKIEKSVSDYDNIDILKGKLILKDSKGDTGGLQCSGNIIEVETDSDLTIENGQYIVEKGDQNRGVIQNQGGILEINNGIFKCLDENCIIKISNGQTIINNGSFEGKGTIINVEPVEYPTNLRPDGYLTNLIINGGKFTSDSTDLINLSPATVKINGGTFSALTGNVIKMGEGSPSNRASLTLDGCTLEGGKGALLLNIEYAGWTYDFINCNLKSTLGFGAIRATYHNDSSEGHRSREIIKSSLIPYGGLVFVRFDDNLNIREETYSELVFKDRKLISATGNPNDTDNNTENNTENNTNNNAENNTDNNIGNDTNNNTDNNIENNTGNNTKLPQTGEETNAFARWLSITIILGIFWLVSMIFIDREKKKMTKR